MAKGAGAKAIIENKIATTFGNDYIGISGGKIYVWAPDGPGGEKVQIAISLVCPSKPISIENTEDGNSDWSFGEPAAFPEPAKKVTTTTEITQEEKDTIEELMKRLNL